MLVFDYGKLREVRRALHLKQSDTAAMMKCTAATISNSNFAHPKQACNNAQQGNVTP